MRWANLMPEWIEVCPVQLPGRENRLREPLVRQFDALIRPLIQEIRPFLDGPFAFFGHSMGGIICYELTRQLRRRYLPQPAHIFVSASRAPHIPSRLRHLYTLPDDALIAELGEMQGMPQTVLENQELTALLLPIIRSDFELLASYQLVKEPPFDMPLTAFFGIDDTVIHREEIAEWEPYTAAQFRLCAIDGGHFFIRENPEQLTKFICQHMTLFLHSQ